MHRPVPIIARQFQIHGEFTNVRPFGNGHINDTYALTHDEGGLHVQHIIQRINHHIFTNPPAMMDNIMRVTCHVHQRLRDRDADDIARRCLTVIPTREGRAYTRDDEGNYWRAYVFIERAHTCDKLDKPEQAYQAARAFAAFGGDLLDLPDPPLHETIQDFHNGAQRFRAFEEAVATDPLNRAADARAEIDFVRKHAGLFDIVPALLATGELPLRTTHNDTKVNNVMLDDRTGEGICVIDLDTVMPGTPVYDFGDMVRTMTCRADEDERDPGKVVFEMPLYAALVEGYLSQAAQYLTSAERAHLVHGGQLLTLMVGTRFLTDHLLGDVYYKVHRPSHNLDRCRTQLKLVHAMLDREKDMHAVTASV